jgi:hypothetical protein
MNGKHFSFLKGAIVGILVTLVLSGGLFAYASEQIKILINGQELYSDVPAQIIDGRTMVPLRAIAEGTGMAVDWDASTSTVGIEIADVYSFEEANAYIGWVDYTADKLDYMDSESLHNVIDDDDYTTISKLRTAITIYDDMINRADNIRPPQFRTKRFSYAVKHFIYARETAQLWLNALLLERNGDYVGANAVHEEVSRLLTQTKYYQDNMYAASDGGLRK